MAMTEDPQTSLYETEIENPEVEALLETREKAKTSKKQVTKRFKDADNAAKARLQALDLGADAPVRIGRFLVSLKRTAGRQVSFETGPGERLWIGLLPEPKDA